MSGEKYQRACVTGGAGFIGSYVVRSLLARNIEVTVVDNLSTGRSENVPAGVRLIEGNILNEGVLREAFANCDVVLHLAARVAIRSSFEYALDDTLTNVAGTAGVLRAAQLAGQVRKVVTTSSMAVYADSPTGRPVDETHPTEPISPYGVSKLAAERLTHLMCANAGMQSVALRLFNTYGVGQRWSPYVGVVTIFINKLLRGERPTIFGDGQQCRDFVHAADVAEGFVKAIESDVTGETINIGSGVSRSINSILQSISRSVGADCHPEYAPAADGELRHSVADITKAAKLLGYSPARDFDYSLAEVVAEIAKSTENPSLVKA